MSRLGLIMNWPAFNNKSFLPDAEFKKLGNNLGDEIKCCFDRAKNTENLVAVVFQGQYHLCPDEGSKC